MDPRVCLSVFVFGRFGYLLFEPNVKANEQQKYEASAEHAFDK